jgi:IS4 transposase
MLGDFAVGAKRRPVPANSNIVCDQIVRLGQGRYRTETLIRRVVVRAPETKKKLVFLTNQMELAASTIARIYRDRWQIESFFRALKQCLRVKTFVGTSANALKTQIWIALIAMLLLKHLQLKAAGRCRIWWPCCASNCLCIAICGLG